MKLLHRVAVVFLFAGVLTACTSVLRKVPDERAFAWDWSNELPTFCTAKNNCWQPDPEDFRAWLAERYDVPVRR